MEIAKSRIQEVPWLNHADATRIMQLRGNTRVSRCRSGLLKGPLRPINPKRAKKLIQG